jgi:hypothetical protein
LKWNAAISKSGAHLNDDAAISRKHSPERRERAIYHAEISYFRNPLVLFRLHLLHGRKHRNHCVVDPNVNRTELALNSFSRLFNPFSIRYVYRNHQSFAA